MASSAFPPAFILYQEQANSKPFKDILPFLQTPGSRQGISRSSIIVSNEQNDLRNIRSGLNGYNQFLNFLAVRRMSLPAEFQGMLDDSILSNFSMDEQRNEILEFLMSRSSDLMEDYDGPSIVLDLMGLRTIPFDMHLKDDVASINFQLDDCFREKESFRDSNGYSYNQEPGYDFVYDVPYSRMSRQPEGRLPLFGTIADMKDMRSVLTEFSAIKDSAQSNKQQVLVPHFTWSEAIDLQDHVHSSSMYLETMTASPLKSPKKVRSRPSSKRKTNKPVRERNLYRNNSLHAFETILSLIVDRNRNGKSMMTSLKKSGPELPQLLTQFSASITGTGLAVMFSVVYKVACGSLQFSSSNLLTSSFGVGLFWLSWAVNGLRDTIVYIRKNFSKAGFEEEGMITRVDESVKDILFRIVTLMTVLMLRFA